MTADGWLGLICLFSLILMAAAWFVGSKKASADEYDPWGVE